MSDDVKKIGFLDLLNRPVWFFRYDKLLKEQIKESYIQLDKVKNQSSGVAQQSAIISICGLELQTRNSERALYAAVAISVLSMAITVGLSL